MKTWEIMIPGLRFSVLLYRGDDSQPSIDECWEAMQRTGLISGTKESWTYMLAELGPRRCDYGFGKLPQGRGSAVERAREELRREAQAIIDRQAKEQEQVREVQDGQKRAYRHRRRTTLPDSDHLL